MEDGRNSVSSYKSIKDEDCKNTNIQYVSAVGKTILNTHTLNQ